LIQLLQHHEQDQLEDWYDLDEKEQAKFLRSLAKYFKSHPDELEEYCTNLHPTEFSSLSLVYAGLSTYSHKFTDFLFTEIKRVIELAVNNEIDPELTEVLTDIEMGDIYEKEYETYREIINYLLDSLSEGQPDDLKIALLEVLDYFLLESTEDDDDNARWQERIDDFLGSASQKVRDNFTPVDVKTTSRGGLLWMVLFFLGLVAQIFAIKYYRKTVIELPISMGIYGAVGILAFFAFERKTRHFLSQWYYRIFFFVVSFGGITIWSVIYTNFEFASKDIYLDKYEIIEKSSMPGDRKSERQPLVYIMMDSTKKELVFPPSETGAVQTARYVTIMRSEGYLGFDVIRGTALE